MLTNRYADSISDTEAIMIAKAGPLETWMNLYTLESEIFVEIPVRNGRLSGVLVKIQMAPSPEERPFPEPPSLSTTPVAERPLPPSKRMAISTFILYLLFIFTVTGSGVGAGFILLKRLLSWQ